MKIRITQPGWAGYTGDLGQYAFVDGVSVEDIGKGDAAHLAGIVSVENIEDGSNPSHSQRLVDANTKSAKVETVIQGSEPVKLPDEFYTKSQLEGVADISGIQGIRKISDPVGLKGTSISDLIDKILSQQSDKIAADLKLAKAAAEIAKQFDKAPEA